MKNSNFNLSRITSLLIIFFILITNLKAQIQEPTEKATKHAVGAGAGFTTGYGLSYRYIPNRFGIQINFAPFKNATTTRNSIGLTLLYSLMQSEKTNLYLYQANHYYVSSQPADSFNNITNQTYSYRKDESYFNNGIGFGLEYIIAPKIGFNIMTGYATYVNFSGYNVTGETALYFKF